MGVCANPPCVGSISGGCHLLASCVAWALWTLAFLHARCGGLCASHKLALAASGHKPGVSGEKGPGFLSLQDLDFSSVTQKYLGYCRKWVLFVWLHPGRPSLLGWRRTRASEPCDGAFSFFIASGAQRLEERTQVWPLPLYMSVWILHFSRLCCTSFCESQKLFATRLLVSPDFPILN